MAISLNLHDLQFILKQIKIAEAHSNGAALTEIRINPATGEVITDPLLYGSNGQFLGDASWGRAIPDPKTPFGLRTVDGSYNNLVEGREYWGAADQLMPRYFDQSYRDGGPETPIDVNGPAPGGIVTNTNYGSPGDVVDTDPRVISNLVVDMSANNPAALWAALKFAESADPYADLAQLLALRISPQAALDQQAAAAQLVADKDVALDAAVLAYASAANPSPAQRIQLIDAIQEAAINLQAAEDALARADALVADPDAAFRALAEEKGLVFDAGGSLVIPNVAPDEGISAPFNAWMTFFGQFFDHGLDLITKGGNGTVWIPLKPDDPLITHGPDGIANSGDEIPPQLAFMAMTRATPTMGAGADGIMGTADDTQDHINTTTPFVDQNQTYTSHASHQVFLREYKMVFDPVLQTMVPVATGRLLEGQNGGLATWKDVKDQAREMLGIELTDADVLNVPLVYTDPYGQFIRGANGLPQLVTGLNADGTPSGLVSGNLGAPVGTFASGVARIDHAFLDDIAHTAAPIGRQGPLARAEDGIINDANANGVIDAGETPLAPGTYDGDLLDRHFITGDGRGNENFGLTAVHHVFHSEHNRQTIIQKLTILKDGDLAFVNEWLATDISASDLAAIKAGIAAAQAPGSAAPNLYTYLNGLNLNWDGERVFQAARFATEMQYQHLVFEEFGRKIQPAIDPFVFNSVTDINPAIFAEFANVVYRFGHSMLTDEMPRAFYSPDASTNHLSIVDEGLVAAFLDPVAYDLDGTISSEEAAGAVVRGLTNVRGNAIDEFVIDALRNNLLGLPLDLAAINIARGRDTGMPTLNEARAQLFAATGSSFLKPYANWTEFAIGLKNPLSVVNFIAAYGTHADIVNATTMADKRAVAMELVFGVEADGTTPSDIANRADFINGTGIYAGNKGGLDNVDLWIGGLAEKILLFGGMLGSTFTAIFEAQMENLQDADRFYYLTRTQGLNFLDALEANAFSKMIMANTDLALPGPDGIRGTGDDIIRHHIGIDSFAKYDFILEINQQYQQDYNGAAAGKDPLGNDAVLQGMGLDKVSRMMPGSFDANFYDNYIRFFGGEHVVLGGTSGNDIIFGDLGDDAIWGGAGDDYIEGGQGVDLILGGYGNDIILDEGDEGDFIKGEEGDDVIASSNGLDILMGGDGKDVIFAGADATEVFAGKGNDFVLGGPGADFLLGNEGDDWLEAGGGFDTTAGDNSELFFNSTVIGHDVMFAGSDEHDFDAESGDDIMVQGESVMRNEGMFGFDWSIFKGVERDAYADLRVGIFTTDEQDILRNRFDKVEALSGWKHNDTLIGDDRVAGDILPGAITATTEGIFFNDQLSQAGVDRIDGLRALLGSLVAAAPAGASAAELEAITAFTGGNILLGGAGSDTLRGNAGDDVIDGDAWLNVRIRITNNPGDANTQANQLATVDSLKHIFTAQDAGDPSWVGKSLFELLIARQIVPAQMHIVREILDGGQTGDVDVAVFNDDLFDADGNLNYLITANADGTVRVEHVNVTTAIDPATGRQLLSDGVDILRNIERLRFRDVEIDAPEPNSLPTGAPIIIDPTPTNGLVSPTGGLALSSSIASIQDANGLPTSPAGFAYQWQSSTNNGTTWTDIPGATGPNFTPSNGLNGLGGQVGAILRLRVSYEDADGYDEVVYSAPTMVVGANWNGVPLINNTFNGTAGNDIADGVDPFLGFLGGADTLNGFAGDDILNGNGGNDTLNGGAGNDTLNGGGGTDVAVYAGGVGNFALGSSGTSLIVTDLTGAEGTDTLTGIETLRFAGANYTVVTGTAAANNNLNGAAGTAGSQAVFGLAGDDVINGGAGADLLVGGAGSDRLNGGTGNDTIYWTAGDGRDVMDGGADTDTAKIVGDASAETFRIYALSGGQNPGLAAALGTTFLGATEIVITRQVAGGNETVVAELDNIEEIVINGRGGGDTFIPIGNFTPTSLLTSTITIEGGSGDDVVDITALQSAHRVVFRSNGGNDTVIGTLRSQDSIELPVSNEPGTYQVTSNGDGTTTVFDATSSVTFKGAPASGPGSVRPTFLDSEDLLDLRDMVRDGLVRDSSGFGNNVANPGWGSAGHEFIRLTDAHYTDGARGVRETALSPREISNIVSNQDNDGNGAEESIPNTFNGSSLLTFFGQYFDHGLGFIAKGGPGNVQIGADGFPISAPRANIVEGTGVDGIPARYINSTSPFVDQNQAYGSHNAITDLLRKWVVDGNGQAQQTAYLLTGALDDGGRALLPTLNHIRQNHIIMTGQDLTEADIGNYKGTGQALLIDFIPAFLTLPDGSRSEQLDLDAIGHYFVTGDGRTNENVMLTSIHTIWARNHNFWVDALKAQTNNAWSEAEYFEAARMMNIAEYQQVVFTEFATAIAGPLGDDDNDAFDFEHGFEGYDPSVDASISVEFAQAVYRFGHSMLNESVVYRDADGNLQQVSLVQSFLQPNQVSAIGVDALLSGATAVSHQAIDVDVVNALRNQLVGRPLDLAALNIFRGRDMGVGPLNTVRLQLWEQTGKNSLRPYSGWEDFQARNNLSAAFIAQLKEAYSGDFEAVDLWIGGLAEKPVNGQLGSTFGYIFREQMDRLQHGDRFYYLEIFDDSIFGDNIATFSKIIMRNTGLTDLPANVFQHDGVIDPATLGAGAPDDEDDGEGTDPVVTDPDDGEDGEGTGPVGTDPDPVGGDEDEDEEDEGEDDDAPTPAQPVPGGVQVGTEAADTLQGTDGDDTLIGLGGADRLFGGKGNDALQGGEGDDFLSGGEGRDVLFGGAGHDDLFGGAGADMLYGDAGNDRLFGEEGDDLLNGGRGRDTIFGGAGNDVFAASVGDGDDVYYGGDMMVDEGNDTLDMSVITAAITADLGTGFLGRGSVASAQSGNDTIWGIENIITGSGDDTITASRAVNVMDGGAGNDTFRFLSGLDADGDTIVGFQPGDKIDLSAIDANACTDGNQAFTLVSGAFSGARGELLVTFEERGGDAYTIVQGNMTGGTQADFKIALKGTHELSAGDFHL